jgi:hypothetical protein
MTKPEWMTASEYTSLSAEDRAIIESNLFEAQNAKLVKLLRTPIAGSYHFDSKLISDLNAYSMDASNTILNRAIAIWHIEGNVMGCDLSKGTPAEVVHQALLDNWVELGEDFAKMYPNAETE